uniref:Cathepsin L n=1 Tax=Aceria tosichella TaxID=561515 RepID=A0A6G1SMV2_9ACAR
MKPSALLVLVFLAEISCQIVLARQESSLKEWLQYKRQYGKVYESPEEDAHRYLQFLATKQRIDQHNNGNKQVSYKLGLNQMADWTQKELAQLNEYRSDSVAVPRSWPKVSQRIDPYLQSILSDRSPLPTEIDWRKVPNRVTGVKTQKGCNSGWAFATTGVLEGQQVARNFTKQLIPLSEQQIIDCTLTAGGCSGGQVSDALHYVAAMGGIDSERDYPYTAQYGLCWYLASKIAMKITGFAELGGDDNLKRLVANFGPVAIAFHKDSHFSHYKSGIIDDPCRQKELTEWALVVGYGKDAKVGEYWIVKSSLTPSWGENGYFRIKRGICSIGSVITVPTF